MCSSPGNGEYLKLVARHPLELSASYARHVFNGLDVKYPTPYVRDLRDTSTALSLLEYTLIFLALARLLATGARRALGGVRWAGLLVLAASCIGVLQVQAEPRYFLPLQLLIYLLVCFGPMTRQTLFAGRERRVTAGRRIRGVRARLPHALLVHPRAARAPAREHRDSLGYGLKKPGAVPMN